MLPEYHYHEHKEYRAPTDESVRLLREMEQRAKESVIAAVRTTDNQFECVVHQMYDCISACKKFAVIFKLNGKKHDVLIDVFDHEPREKIIDAVVSKVAERIAVEVIREPLTKVMRQF